MAFRSKLCIVFMEHWLHGLHINNPYMVAHYMVCVITQQERWGMDNMAQALKRHLRL